eukprot:maker-scaffold_6-snap-gene-2.1-mRNA-1 protein AED:0.08 eAED:0.08 QI:0/0/0.5/1/0/0/2/159/449
MTGASERVSGWESSSLYIGDLALDVTESDLYSVFNQFGNLNSVKVCRNWDTGMPLGYGFLNFGTYDSASRALTAYNFKEIKGKCIRLMYSTKRSALSMKESEAANVFVKGLKPEVEDKLLHQVFSKCGTVLSARVARNKLGKSLGYGYVSFTTFTSAQNCLQLLKGYVLLGQTITVEHFVDKKLRSEKPWSNVHIAGIPAEWDKFTLKRRFSIYGNIKSAVVMSTRTPGANFGFVDFEQHDSAVQAVEDNSLGYSSLAKKLSSISNRQQMNSWLDPIFYALLRVTPAMKKDKKHSLISSPAFSVPASPSMFPMGTTTCSRKQGHRRSVFELSPSSTLASNQLRGYSSADSLNMEIGSHVVPSSFGGNLGGINTYRIGENLEKSGLIKRWSDQSRFGFEADPDISLLGSEFSNLFMNEEKFKTSFGFLDADKEQKTRFMLQRKQTCSISI